MRSNIVKRNELRLTEFWGIHTAAPSMLELFALLQRVARSDVTVLIRGESGTGKELVARAIHGMSVRASRPFEAINCATLTGELLASELFGHVRGAFTGAVRDHRGLFARAHRGTVFLDEVAELPLNLQAHLLRVVQERAFTPVGGSRSIRVDVRLVSATLKSLRQLVEAHRFREDLMYRIRVVPVFLPTLRERGDDIAALSWLFIEEFEKTFNRQLAGIESSAFDALHGYLWPGNVRELQNAILHAFVVGTGPTLRLEDLPPELRGEPPPGKKGRTLRELEIARILKALEDSDGVKGKAAELLGISRSTLWRKLREYGLEG